MEEDKISQLPNEIIQHILSFIDIHEAVQTTILSKRWKDLWRSLPGLRLHLPPNTFSDFVSHFLLHRDATAPVHSLHLSFYNKLHLELVEECLLYAINRGVQSLHLHGPHDLPTLRLPDTLFTSTTLRELELRLFNTLIHVPGRPFLPNLKTLYLETHTFLYDGNRTEPFSGLPELEKLSLRSCLVTGLVLKAPKLRVLEILDSSFIEEISAPLLTSFRYEGVLPLECLKMNLPIFEQVYLDIHGIRYSLESLHLNCVRLFHQLRNC